MVLRRQTMVSSKGSGIIISLSRAKSYVGRKAKPGNAFFELVIEKIKYHQTKMDWAGIDLAQLA
jgi:hypothetical protein